MMELLLCDLQPGDTCLCNGEDVTVRSDAPAASVGCIAVETKDGYVWWMSPNSPVTLASRARVVS